MKTILFFHHSADMYGADKVLLALVRGIDPTKFKPIVLLPCAGPLTDEFSRAGIEFHVVPLLLAGRALFSLKGMLQLPLNALRSLKAIKKVISVDAIDFVHSNTLAVLSGALWARLNGIRHIWHVHELIENPWVVRKGFGWLLRFLADTVVCNSYATQRLILRDQPAIEYKTVVVWNGISCIETTNMNNVNNFRKDIGLTDADILVTLVGRINRWKGQRLLVDAAELVEKQAKVTIHYLMIGSAPPGQNHFLDSLMTKVKLSPVRTRITIKEFTSDIATVWAASDIAVVPSTEPEPFGMVALEAMMAGKPVVAANHGGLAEIVVNQETGLLFVPNDANALANAIQQLVSDAQTRICYGNAGLQRGAQIFSLDSFLAGMEKVYEKI